MKLDAKLIDESNRVVSDELLEDVIFCPFYVHLDDCVVWLFTILA